MKLRDGIVIVEDKDEFLLVTVGDASNYFSGMIRMNASAAYLVKMLQKGKSEKDILKALIENYIIEEENAKIVLRDVINKLSSINLIEKYDEDD